MTDSSQTENRASDQQDAQQQLAKSGWELASLALHGLGRLKVPAICGVLILGAIYFYREQDRQHQDRLTKQRDAHQRQLAEERQSAQKEVAEKKLAAEELFTRAIELLQKNYRDLNELGSSQIQDMKAVAELKDSTTKKTLEQLKALQELQTQAVEAQRKADLAKEEAKTATARADKARRELDEISKNLEAAKAERDKAQGAVATVRDWEQLFQVAALAGVIAVNDDVDKAQQWHAKLRHIGSEVFSPQGNRLPGSLGPTNVRFDQSVNRMDDLIDEWKSSGVRPKQLRQEVLAVALLCREYFRQAPPVVQTFAVALESALYDQATAVTQRLAATTSWDAAEADRDEFWSLYYGKLVFVESKSVEGAMVDYGQALNEWEDEKDASDAKSELLAERRRDLARALAEACSSTLRDRSWVTEAGIK